MSHSLNYFLQQLSIQHFCLRFRSTWPLLSDSQQFAAQLKRYTTDCMNIEWHVLQASISSAIINFLFCEEIDCTDAIGTNLISGKVVARFATSITLKTDTLYIKTWRDFRW